MTRQHTIPTSWIRQQGPYHTVVKVPLEAHTELFRWGKTEDDWQDGRWEWLGCPSEAAWLELLRHGDRTARKRAEARGAGAVMESAMKAHLEAPRIVQSVVGSVVVPAAIAGHPLACVRRQQVAQPVKRLWVDLHAPASETAESFFGRMTRALAECVAASRRQPVEVVAYTAGVHSSAYPFDRPGICAYTVVPVSLHTWARLGQVLHPTFYRTCMFAVVGLGSARNAHREVYQTSRGYGAQALKKFGIDIDTFKP